jgi:RHS repeat-associated protein
VDPIFGGLRWVAGPGLYLAKRRWMDPEHGWFIAPDPQGYVDSPALYPYALQNPVDNIDPNGEVVPLILAVLVIGGALAGAGYSFYDAMEHPDRYQGGWGSLRILGNVFGGAIIGGAAFLAGEVILGLGGAGMFATGTAATGATATGATGLTAAQTFVLYGTSSAASGAILRGGFNSMFPDYVNPVSPGTIAFDYVTGGGIGTIMRAVAPAAGEVPSFAPRSWARYGTDAGGLAADAGSLGPYPGRIGALLDRIGIRQGNASTITNLDAGGPWYARVDTGAHEGFHAFVNRYFPTFRALSNTNRFWGGAARYPEEVVAYAIGRAASLRVHGIPMAPFDAFGSLAASGYSPLQQTFAKWFWGSMAALGATGVGVGVAHADTPSNDKPPGAK